MINARESVIRGKGERTGKRSSEQAGHDIRVIQISKMRLKSL